MRSLVLALALAALLAPSTPASISQPESFEKKLNDAVKEVLDKDAQIPQTEDVEQANTIKDIDNQLLKQGPEPIPVKVVVEDVQPALKVSEEKKDEKDDADIKRVEVDLKHPGEPQRQEHETQNPEHYEDEQGAVATIKQMIRDSQVVFNDGFKDVSQHIEEWLRDNKPEISIKDSIDNLQETFMENIHKLNATIQSYWNQDKDAEKQVNIQKVQSSLKVLEEKFENGVETLNNGVRNLAVQKSENRDDATTTAKPSGIQFPGFVTNFWNTVQNGFGNVTNQFQNIIGQNNSTTQAAGTQSDEQSGSTSRPTVWQGIQNQFQGIFQNRPGQQQGAQNDEQPAQPGAFAQVIQNVPLLQNIVNFIQPKPQTAEPAKPAEPTPEGSNVVPAESAQAASEPAKPTDQQQKKPDQEIQPAAQGPIQQIIQKNPIVQSIAGAVQKIQHSITNPEKPREEVVQQEGAEKAGFYPYYGGHGHRPGDGDNNDSGSGVEKSAPVQAGKSAPVEPQVAPVEAQSAPVEVQNSPVVAQSAPEAVKSAPVEAQSAPEAAKIVPEAVKSAPVEAQSAPVEAQSAPVKVEVPAPVSSVAVKQD